MQVALLPDFAEEGWPSMDLMLEMLSREYAGLDAADIHWRELRPPFRRFWPAVFGSGPRLRNSERLCNRFCSYPSYLRKHAAGWDVFHILDHSYSQLVHDLPASRVVVTCHDLDTFRCLLAPDAEPRPAWFRAMARRILRGLQKARWITCPSQATRQALEQYQIISPDRICVIPNGVDPVCSQPATPEAQAAARELLPEGRGEPWLLHVGSTIPRKRMELLLQILARLQDRAIPVRLAQVGGELTPAQERLARDATVRNLIYILPFVPKATLAAIYRRAALLVLPSRAEGFCLPLAEAQACGLPAAVTDLPVMRETGGPATSYLPLDDPDAWTQKITDLLLERASQPSAWQARSQIAQGWAGRFSWRACAEQMLALYRQIADTV